MVERPAGLEVIALELVFDCGRLGEQLLAIASDAFPLSKWKASASMQQLSAGMEGSCFCFVLKIVFVMFVVLVIFLIFLRCSVF